MELLISIIVVAVIIGMVYLIPIEEPYETGYPTHYKTLGTRYTNPLFTPCLAKRCSGGPYMFSDNPRLRTACAGISSHDMAQCACGKGFKGKPVHFDYTPISDAKWSNEMCDADIPQTICNLGNCS